MKTQFKQLKNLILNRMSSQKTFLFPIMLLIVSMISSCSDVVEEYKVVFWFNETTSNSLLDEGIDSLTFNLNGHIVASTPVDDVYWTTPPSCNDKGAITATITLKPSEDDHVFFFVGDQTGHEYQSSILNLKSTLENNHCNSIEIVPNKVKVVH